MSVARATASLRRASICAARAARRGRRHARRIVAVDGAAPGSPPRRARRSELGLAAPTRPGTSPAAPVTELGDALVRALDALGKHRRGRRAPRPHRDRRARRRRRRRLERDAAEAESRARRSCSGGVAPAPPLAAQLHAAGRRRAPRRRLACRVADAARMLLRTVGGAPRRVSSWLAISACDGGRDRGERRRRSRPTCSAERAGYCRRCRPSPRTTVATPACWPTGSSPPLARSWHDGPGDRGHGSATADHRRRSHPLVLGPCLGSTTAIWERAVPYLAPTHPVLRLGPARTRRRRRPPGSRSRRPRSRTGCCAPPTRPALNGSPRWGSRSAARSSLELALAATDRVTSVDDDLLAVRSSATAEPGMQRAAEVRAMGTLARRPRRPRGGSHPGSWRRQPDVARRVLHALLDIDDESYALCCDALGVVRPARPDRATWTPVRDHRRGARRRSPARGCAEPRSATARDGRLLDRRGGVAPAAVEQPDVGGRSCSSTPPTPEEHHDHPMSDTRANRACACAARCSPTSTSTGRSPRTTDTADFQEYITRVAWGDIWSRPGLDRRSRRIVVLSTLMAPGRHEELAMHLRAALAQRAHARRDPRDDPAGRPLLGRPGGEQRVPHARQMHSTRTARERQDRRRCRGSARGHRRTARP